MDSKGDRVTIQSFYDELAIYYFGDNLSVQSPRPHDFHFISTV